MSNLEDKIYKDMQSEQDPFGSYTGVPENEYDTPEQDVDDL